VREAGKGKGKEEREEGGPLDQDISQGIHTSSIAWFIQPHTVQHSAITFNPTRVHRMQTITANTLTMQKIQPLPLSTLALARWNLLDNQLLLLGSFSHPIKVSLSKLFSRLSSFLLLPAR
jgi:hypothetical protein